ncbi:MAG: hypothetical protein LBP71_04250 [Spirochaetaceae bacterium]|jgi:hypothetical protein|nr:hypothetical protein [Spirochaetaceae bacterium]
MKEAAKVKLEKCLRDTMQFVASKSPGILPPIEDTCNEQAGFLFGLYLLDLFNDSYAYQALRSELYSEQIMKQRRQLSEFKKKQAAPEHGIK